MEIHSQPLCSQVGNGPGDFRVPFLCPWLTQRAHQEQCVFSSLCLNVTGSQGVSLTPAMGTESSVQTDLRSGELSPAVQLFTKTRKEAPRG